MCAVGHSRADDKFRIITYDKIFRTYKIQEEFQQIAFVTDFLTFPED